MRRKAFLAAVGDSNSPVTWSGIPYHFLQAARAQRIIDEGLPLGTDGLGWKIRRLSWNSNRLLKGDSRGGYQYSTDFLERLWSPVLPRIRNSIVANCFQLYPPSVVEDGMIEKWFFIDQTLLQLFDYYQLRATIGRRIATEAIEREREGYNAAAGIIVHSRWAAESVITDYGISPDQVHVVPPGANIDMTVYERWVIHQQIRRRQSSDNQPTPLKLVFVGKYWNRKGLDRLLEAIAVGRRAGLRATLKVIGCERSSVRGNLRDVEGVDWLGFIDKRTEAARFLRELSECDVGCLLSRVEAGGIALREYHALGLVVLGPDTGGAPEHMIRDASIAVSPEATADDIACTLSDLEHDRSRFDKLHNAAWSQRHSALWDESVRQIISFWPDAESNSEAIATLSTDLSPHYHQVGR